MQASPQHPPPVPHSQPARRRSCLVPVLILLAVAALIGGGLWWYFSRTNRSIEPVHLSPEESQVLEEKIGSIQAMDPERPDEPEYVKGEKEIVFTEREINGLLHQNSELGDKVRFEFATDAVHARVEMDLDPDIPIVGGRRLKARARMFVKTVEERPSLILDDLTVWGISVPNAWLGGIKGQDFFSEIVGGDSGLEGIEEFRVEPGKLILRLAE